MGGSKNHAASKNAGEAPIPLGRRPKLPPRGLGSAGTSPKKTPRQTPRNSPRHSPRTSPRVTPGGSPRSSSPLRKCPPIPEGPQEEEGEGAVEARVEDVGGSLQEGGADPQGGEVRREADCIDSDGKSESGLEIEGREGMLKERERIGGGLQDCNLTGMEDSCPPLMEQASISELAVLRSEQVEAMVGAAIEGGAVESTPPVLRSTSSVVGASPTMSPILPSPSSTWLHSREDSRSRSISRASSGDISSPFHWQKSPLSASSPYIGTSGKAVTADSPSLNRGAASSRLTFMGSEQSGKGNHNSRNEGLLQDSPSTSLPELQESRLRRRDDVLRRSKSSSAKEASGSGLLLSGKQTSPLRKMHVKRRKPRRTLFEFLGIGRGCACGMSPGLLPISPVREFPKVNPHTVVAGKTETEANWNARKGEKSVLKQSKAKQQDSSLSIDGAMARGELTANSMGSPSVNGPDMWLDGDTDTESLCSDKLMDPRRYTPINSVLDARMNDITSEETGRTQQLGPLSLLNGGSFDTGSEATVISAFLGGREAANTSDDPWESSSGVSRNEEVWEIRSVGAVSDEEQAWEVGSVVSKVEDQWEIHTVVGLPEGGIWDEQVEGMKTQWEDNKTPEGKEAQIAKFEVDGSVPLTIVNETWDGSETSRCEDAWEVNTWDVLSCQSGLEDGMEPMSSNGFRSEVQGDWVEAPSTPVKQSIAMWERLSAKAELKWAGHSRESSADSASGLVAWPASRLQSRREQEGGLARGGDIVRGGGGISEPVLQSANKGEGIARKAVNQFIAAPCNWPCVTELQTESVAQHENIRSGTEQSGFLPVDKETPVVQVAGDEIREEAADGKALPDDRLKLITVKEAIVGVQETDAVGVEGRCEKDTNAKQSEKENGALENSSNSLFYEEKASVEFLSQPNSLMEGLEAVSVNKGSGDREGNEIAAVAKTVKLSGTESSDDAKACNHGSSSKTQSSGKMEGVVEQHISILPISRGTTKGIGRGRLPFCPAGTAADWSMQGSVPKSFVGGQESAAHSLILKGAAIEDGRTAGVEENHADAEVLRASIERVAMSKVELDGFETHMEAKFLDKSSQSEGPSSALPQVGQTEGVEAPFSEEAEGNSMFRKTLEELGLGAMRLTNPKNGKVEAMYPPGRLAQREFGPIARARRRVQACRDHWSWLFMEFLELLVRGLTGEVEQGEAEWGDDNLEGLRVARPRRHGGQESPARLVAAAKREFEWLERKFDGVAHSLGGLEEAAVPVVFTAAMACWLKYWENWAGKPSSWGQMGGEEEERDEEEEGEREEGVERGAKRGTALQQRLVEQGLLGEFAPASEVEIIRSAGFAAAISQWQPATAAMILLRLLSRLSQFSQLGGSGSHGKAACAFRPACRTFVSACLNALLSARRVQMGRSAAADKTDRREWVPLKLSELAEAALAQGIAAAKHADLMQRMDEIDRLYASLDVGPGLLAMSLAAESRSLPGIHSEDLHALSVQVNAMGCFEAAFSLGIQAVRGGALGPTGFDHVIAMVFGGRGAAPATMRFAQLASAVKEVHSASPEGSSYIADFADAMLRSREMQKHRWAYEVTLSFVRIHSRRGGALASGEVGLCAQVILARWLAAASEEERAGGYLEMVEAMDHPEEEVGWRMWVCIGKTVEERHRSQMPQLLKCLRRKAILGTFEKLEEDGSSNDIAALEAFDWAIGSLLLDLPEIQPAVTLLEDIDPEEEDVGDILLAIAERMAGRTYGRWAHADETSAFVAQLLLLAEQKGAMDEPHLQRAVQVGLRLWGWAMPKPQQLAVMCETEEEAREVLERAVVAMWQSVAVKGMVPREEES